MQTRPHEINTTRDATSDRPSSVPAEITSPDDSALARLATKLAERAGTCEGPGDWPAEQLAWCGQAGVDRWFVDRRLGGLGWSDAEQVRGYLALGAACLTTTFILTQRTGALRRIAGAANQTPRDRLLGELLRGERFATVGISHLTTSRRHLARPVLRAVETAEGFLFDGASPWVTGARAADWIVTGATLDDERQVLAVVPTGQPGVVVGRPLALAALAGSQTGEVRFDNVLVPRDWVLAGPVENVMATGSGAGTGGLQTSTLAAGLASAAIGWLEAESTRRSELQVVAAQLRTEQQGLVDDLLAAASGNQTCSHEELRVRANSLALRGTQATLAAAKGTGFVAGHPAGRWCREALFFLVWSCPQGVVSAQLCELAGLAD